MRCALTTEFTISSHNHLLLKRFSRVSIVELLTLRANCSLLARKPAHSTRLLPLEARGYRGSYASVHDNIVRRLQFGSRKTPADASSKTPPLPTPRRAAFLFLRRPEKLRVEEQEMLAKLCQIHPEVGRTYDLVQQFVQMLHTRTGERLDTWLAQVQSSELPELQSFAAGVERDKDAVRAGLTWWISNDMVEGHVTKLKLIKRQGYGRAEFPLLRKRVLHAM